MKYLQITENFAIKYNGYTESPNIFIPLQTNTGAWVCDSDCVDKFPSIFNNQAFKEIELIDKDLKPDYSRLTLLINNKFRVFSKMDDYYNQKVTLVYIKDDNKQTITIDMAGVILTKTGYSIDIDSKIKASEA